MITTAIQGDAGRRGKVRPPRDPQGEREGERRIGGILAGPGLRLSQGHLAKAMLRRAGDQRPDGGRAIMERITRERRLIGQDGEAGIAKRVDLPLVAAAGGLLQLDPHQVVRIAEQPGAIVPGRQTPYVGPGASWTKLAAQTGFEFGDLRLEEGVDFALGQDLVADEPPAGRLIAGAHAQRKLVDDVGIAKVAGDGPPLGSNMVPVEPAGQQELRGKCIGGDLLQVTSADRGQRAAVENLAIDAATVFQDGMPQFVRTGEPLDVEAPLGGDHDSAERRREAQTKGRGKALEDEGDVELADHLEDVDQTGALGDAPLEIEVAMQLLGGRHGLETGGGGGRSSHGSNSAAREAGETRRTSEVRRDPRRRARSRRARVPARFPATASFRRRR